MRWALLGLLVMGLAGCSKKAAPTTLTSEMEREDEDRANNMGRVEGGKAPPIVDE